MIWVCLLMERKIRDSPFARYCVVRTWLRLLKPTFGLPKTHFRFAKSYIGTPELLKGASLGRPHFFLADQESKIRPRSLMF